MTEYTRYIVNFDNPPSAQRLQREVDESGIAADLALDGGRVSVTPINEKDRERLEQLLPEDAEIQVDTVKEDRPFWD